MPGLRSAIFPATLTLCSGNAAAVNPSATARLLNVDNLDVCLQLCNASSRVAAGPRTDTVLITRHLYLILEWLRECSCTHLNHKQQALCSVRGSHLRRPGVTVGHLRGVSPVTGGS
jgi:hypothetical protein